MPACLFLYISKSLLLFCSYLKIYTFKCAAFKHKHLRGRAVKCRNCPMFCNGSWVQFSAAATFFFPFFLSASLYIIVSFEVYLIAEKKITCTGRFRGSNIFQGWGSNSIAFKVSPGHLLPPPPLRVRA